MHKLIILGIVVLAVVVGLAFVFFSDIRDDDGIL
jgi:hypothetical protein